MGLHLGMEVHDWTPEEAAGADQKLFVTPLSNVEHSTLDEELCAAVEAAIPENRHRIVYARTGWKGGPILTLEQLASDPARSGHTQRVTRERIRQLEGDGLRRIRARNFGTPVLDRALKEVRDRAPLSVDDVQRVLRETGLSDIGLGFQALNCAAAIFGRNWGAEWSRFAGVEYVHWRDDIRDAESFDGPHADAATPQPAATDPLRNLLAKMLVTRPDLVVLERATKADFVSVRDFEDGSSSESEVSQLVVRMVVHYDPRLEWLDQAKGIFWIRSRARIKWNKTLNVCEKIFSVAGTMKIESLHSALKRTRTVDIVPPIDVFRSMLIRNECFTLDGDLVRPARGMNFSRLNPKDRILLSACQKLGSTVNYTALRDFCVRKGMSSNSASVLIVQSPFLSNVARGYYWFIVDPSEIVLTDERESFDGFVIDIDVTDRHLVTGTHRVDRSGLRPGPWTVKTIDGTDLGTIALHGRRLSGLADVLHAASAETGANVSLRFTERDRLATLSVYREAT